MLTDPDEITKAFAVPFGAAEVKFKPQAVKNNKAMAVAFVDARAIMDRLDETVGVGGWEDAYDFLAEGSALCRLRVKIGGEWVCKMDVGSPSEQPDAGDRVKASCSDALKRAAIKYGIGRALYSLPKSWYDYDPVRRQFVKAPTLPASYFGKSAPAPQKSAPPVQQLTPPTNGTPARVQPKDGHELLAELRRYAETKLVGVCTVSELLNALSLMGDTEQGPGPVIEEWKPPYDFVRPWITGFIADRKKPTPANSGSAPPRLPAPGEEFEARIDEIDREFTEEGRCDKYALISTVKLAGRQRDLKPDLKLWGSKDIQWAMTQVVQKFDIEHPARQEA